MYDSKKKKINNSEEHGGGQKLNIVKRLQKSLCNRNEVKYSLCKQL